MAGYWTLARFLSAIILVVSEFAIVSGGKSNQGQTIDDFDMKKLMKMVIRDVSKLTDHIQRQEKSTSQRFEKLEEKIQENTEHVEKSISRRCERMEEKLQDAVERLESKVTESLQLQDIKFTEKLELTKIELIEGVEKMNASIQEAKRDLAKTVKGHAAHTREEIRELRKNVTSEIRDVDARLKVVEKSDVTHQLQNLTLKLDEVRKILTDVSPGKSEGKPADSCDWIRQRSYCVRSGHFWIKGGGEPSLTYCNMRDHSPATTTAVPTTMVSTQLWTTAVPTTELPTTRKPVYRGTSCKELKKRYSHLKSGIYNITLGEKLTEVVCDMETDDGGWLKVGSAVVSKESESEEVVWTKLLSTNISRLAEVKTNRFLLGPAGMTKLQNYTSFEEIRFYCRKEWHGRSVHIKTAKNTLGKDAVNYMIGKSTFSPASCGSYLRMSDDNSNLGMHCEEWRERKWSRGNMYSYPFFINFKSHLSLNPGRIECDDYIESDKANFGTVGSWEFYVR